jgi:hypothetical protein
LQIRYGGAKGVLSRYSRVHGRQMCLRPSQLKFGSSHPQLEVCSVAAWLPAYLNRQVIMMMEHNNVPAEVSTRARRPAISPRRRVCAKKYVKPARQQQL